VATSTRYKNLVDKDGCDTKVWSRSCPHPTATVAGEKYLCDVCGIIVGMDHEIRHEGFPHLSGDYTKLS